MPETIINLTDKDQRDAFVAVFPEALIHISEFERIKELLIESLAASKEYAEKGAEDGRAVLRIRRHDTIMLAGVRGSGKTTFMLSLLNFIEEKKLGLQIGDNSQGEAEIEHLHILDPTLIEGKTHIFLNIISMIRAKVEEKPLRESVREQEQWRESLKRLSEGLPSLDGVGTNGFGSDSWLDAEFVMNKGIRMADSANNLERRFHDFVRQSLQLIGKKAFLLCFDDIDTDFGKGWPVLEMLHKYLTTPQIITVLSGDPSLYSTLIRDRQWANFSDTLVRMDGRTFTDRISLINTITHLEEQYFLKLLKPERRVFLNSLYRKEQRKAGCIQVKGHHLDSPLLDCYKQLLAVFGIHSGGQQASFVRFIASAPLRTQKQLLYAFDRWLDSNKTIDLGSNVIDIFWTNLAEKKVDVSNLSTVPHYTVPHVVDYLTRNDILVEGYTLTPLFSDHCINGAQFALGTLLTDRIKNDPTHIFEYWLRVCLTRELGALMEGRTETRANGPSIRDYVNYCAVTKLRAPRYVSRFSSAYIRSYLGYTTGERASDTKISYDKGTWHGTIPLLGFAGKGKKGDWNRIDYVLDNSDFFTKVMGYLPLSGATNHQGRSLPVYSFYNLLGVLGEILLVARNNGDEAVAINEVTRTILKNAQYREYPVPSWFSGSFSEEDSSPETDDEGVVSQQEMDQMPADFPRAMVSWARAFPPDFVVSPSVLGKIFTRFFYSTNNMDKDLPKDMNLGDWMHRMVVVFLHSVVLVEAMEKLDLAKVRLNLTNPIKKDNIFIDNLKNISSTGKNKELQVSRWLLASPLWRVYLKEGFECSRAIPDTWSVVEQFIEDKADAGAYIPVSNLCTRLNEVAVKRQDASVPILVPHRGTLRPVNKFSLKRVECLTDLQELCEAANINSEDLLLIVADERTDQLQKILATKYTRSSITVRTAKGIAARLEDGRIARW